MSDEKTVFEQTLNAYRERFMALSLEHLAKNPVMSVDGQGVVLPFFNENLHVSDRGVFTAAGKNAGFEVCVVVYNFLLRYRNREKKAGSWVAYRDTRNSGPLTVYFADSVEKKIAAVYGKKRPPLVAACDVLGGRMVENAPGFDLAMVFEALPSCPLLLLFNHEDEDFPASCSVLFQEAVELFLDPESLAILGAVFASKLIDQYPA